MDTNNQLLTKKDLIDILGNVVEQNILPNVDQRIDGLRGEMKNNIDGLRGEMKKEMKNNIDGLRGEMKKEMKNNIDGLRGEMRDLYLTANDKIDDLRNEFLAISNVNKNEILASNDQLVGLLKDIRQEQAAISVSLRRHQDSIDEHDKTLKNHDKRLKKLELNPV